MDFLVHSCEEQEYMEIELTRERKNDDSCNKNENGLQSCHSSVVRMCTD